MHTKNAGICLYVAIAAYQMKMRLRPSGKQRAHKFMRMQLATKGCVTNYSVDAL